MAQSSLIYKISLEISDIDRNLYETIPLRVAQHPSEGAARLVARVLAFALLYEENLEFGRGLSESEEPALWSHDLTGQLQHWIDVGTPGAERIHLASKKASKVSIVCHKGESALARELLKKKIHKSEEIEVLFLEPSFVETIGDHLERTSEWTLVISDGGLNLTVGENNYTGEVIRRPLSEL